jgi:hypothetical protein
MDLASKEPRETKFVGVFTKCDEAKNPEEVRNSLGLYSFVNEGLTAISRW